MATSIQPADPADVVRAIVELIQQRQLKPGDKLPPIRELAREFAVKPTVVRDALLHAQSMGLMRIVPRSGAYVQSLTYEPLVDALASTLSPALMQEDHNLFHLLDARRTLEVELVGRAAKRRQLEDLLPVRSALQGMAEAGDADGEKYASNDIRFHAEIARLAGNPVLLAMHRALLDLLRPYLFSRAADAEEKAVASRSHAAIYAALVKGDAEEAKAETREHLSLAYDSLLREVQNLHALETD
ncbi:MAG TPA: FCD domain-containing protein [Pirellulales bacterium]|nr:FCD domain-containing protein [Pirellulales bacterium]